MKTLIPALMLVWITACGSGGGTASAPSQSPSPAITAQSITIKSGRSFSCFQLRSDVYCKGTDPNLINSPNYVLFASFGAAPSRLEAFDDTVCITASVQGLPYAGLSYAGTATYCWGEANLGMNYIGYPMVYSGPFFTAANVSPEVSFAVLPFVGYDGGMGVFTDEGGTWLVMQDGRSLTSTNTISCDTDGVYLACPTFNIAL